MGPDVMASTGGAAVVRDSKRRKAQLGVAWLKSQ
jgi:hypothetical protein